MLIDPNHGIAKECSDNFWYDELVNKKILLTEIERAILVFTQTVASANGVTEYTLDTGQDRQTVKRSELPNLYLMRDKLISEIAILESRLQIGGSRACQVVPGF